MRRYTIPYISLLIRKAKIIIIIIKLRPHKKFSSFFVMQYKRMDFSFCSVLSYCLCYVTIFQLIYVRFISNGILLYYIHVRVIIIIKFSFFFSMSYFINVINKFFLHLGITMLTIFYCYYYCYRVQIFY